MQKRISFLLVEDDLSAALIAQDALEQGWKKRGVEASVAIASNGQEAIQYLESCTQLPKVILTDVKMPLVDGLQLLGILKANPRFRKIPVVMLSTSDDPKDIDAAFSGQCAGYLIKNSNYKQFSAALEQLQLYWELSCLPLL